MIRPATRDDLPAMIETARRSWLSAFAQTAPFELLAWWASTDRTRALYEASWSEMHVLREGALVAGILHVKGSEINGLWVHPSRQGHGLGTALLRAGEEIVRGAGHDRAWLTCSAFNARALAFYQRQGYEETGRERYEHPSGVSLEEVRMERAIIARKETS